MKDKYYASININLIRKTFDEALENFQNNSIDILHIDGLHTHEAVKHDFESWFPKVKKDGIIIFHDTNVIEDDFGVYKLWEELQEKYVNVTFFHSFGLGVLFLDNSKKEDISQMDKRWQMHYSYLSESLKSG